MEPFKLVVGRGFFSGFNMAPGKKVEYFVGFLGEVVM